VRRNTKIRVKKDPATGRGNSQTLLKTSRIFYAAAPLLAGFALYLFFRNNELPFRSLNAVRDFIRPLKSAIPTIIRGSLPDALWLLSGILFVRLLWRNDARCRTVYLCLFYLMAFLSEILQAFRLIPGTFDTYDLCAYFAVIVLENRVHFYMTRRRIEYVEQKKA
jgi:hypothetical protein